MAMVWDNLQVKIKVAQSHWAEIKKDLGNDTESQSFLSASYLVVTSGVEQIKVTELPDKADGAALQCAWLFKPAQLNRLFIESRKEQKKAKEALQNSAKGSRDESRARTALEKSTALITDLHTHSIELQDDIAVEVRFKSLHIAIIQQIKQHPLVDKDETPMTPASVRVVLRWDEDAK
jgi:hypothetical protein